MTGAFFILLTQTSNHRKEYVLSVLNNCLFRAIQMNTFIQHDKVKLNLPDHCRIAAAVPSLFSTHQQILKEQSWQLQTHHSYNLPYTQQFLMAKQVSLYGIYISLEHKELFFMWKTYNTRCSLNRLSRNDTFTRNIMTASQSPMVRYMSTISQNTQTEICNHKVNSLRAGFSFFQLTYQLANCQLALTGRLSLDALFDSSVT